MNHGKSIFHRFAGDRLHPAFAVEDLAYFPKQGSLEGCTKFPGTAQERFFFEPEEQYQGVGGAKWSADVFDLATVGDRFVGREGIERLATQVATFGQSLERVTGVDRLGDLGGGFADVAVQQQGA